MVILVQFKEMENSTKSINKFWSLTESYVKQPVAFDL